MTKHLKPKRNVGQIPGCILRKRSRMTGEMVTVFDAAEAGLREAPGRWGVLCETHEVRAFFPVQNKAFAASATPDVWCRQCAQAVGSRRQAPAERNGHAAAKTLQKISRILGAPALAEDEKLRRIKALIGK